MNGKEGRKRGRCGKQEFIDKGKADSHLLAGGKRGRRISKGARWCFRQEIPGETMCCGALPFATLADVSRSKAASLSSPWRWLLPIGSRNSE